MMDDIAASEHYNTLFASYRTHSTPALASMIQHSDTSWEHLEQACAAIAEYMYRLTNVFEVKIRFLFTAAQGTHPDWVIHGYDSNGKPSLLFKNIFKTTLENAIDQISESYEAKIPRRGLGLSTVHQYMTQYNMYRARHDLTERQVMIYQGLLNTLEDTGKGFQAADRRTIPGITFPESIALSDKEMFHTLRGDVEVENDLLFAAFRKVLVDFNSLEIMSQASENTRMAAYVILSADGLIHEYYAQVAKYLDSWYTPQLLAKDHHSILVHHIALDSLLLSLVCDAARQLTHDYHDTPVEWSSAMLPTYFPTPEEFLHLVQQCVHFLVSQDDVV